MATSITTAFSTFAQALTNVGFALLNAGLAVFQAIVALFQEIITGVLSIGQAVVKLATDLVQDTLGFVFGEWRVTRGDVCMLTGRPARSQLFPHCRAGRGVLLVHKHTRHEQEG